MRWVPAALLTVALASGAAEAHAQVAKPPQLATAQSMIREGKAEQAWRLLAPLEKRYAGNPEFDLVLAMAATDSGRPNLATLALERVVVLQPGNATARLELARAFYALRDYERAERELQFLLAGDPPAEVRALVAEYRARMRGLPVMAEAPVWWAYAEVALGHDTNPNVATADDSIFVPSLGTELLIDPAFVRDSDKFAALSTGFEYSAPLSGPLTASLAADVDVRSHAEVDAANSRAVDVRARLHQRLGPRDGLHYTLRHSDYDLDHASYRRIESAAVEWRRLFTDRARIALGAQGYRIRYLRQEARANSSDLLVLGGSAAYVLDRATHTLGFAGLFAGLDNAVAGRADGDRHLLGASGGAQRALAPGVEAYLSLAWLYSRYADENRDFAARRRDRQLDFTLGVSWRFAGHWYVRPELSRIRNVSNIEVNDYTRTEASLSLRREWR